MFLAPSGWQVFVCTLWPAGYFFNPLGVCVCSALPGVIAFGAEVCFASPSCHGLGQFADCVAHSWHVATSKTATKTDKQLYIRIYIFIICTHICICIIRCAYFSGRKREVVMAIDINSYM